VRRRSRRSSRATLWGFAGAALLAAGCFAPVAAPISGDPITLLSTGSILARLILVAALGSVALLLLGRRRLLLVTGTIAGLMVLAELVAFQSQLAVVSGSNVSAEAVLRSVSYEWGWALLVVGVGLLLLSGLVPVRSRRPPRASG
jgi:hypothetical protein